MNYRSWSQTGTNIRCKCKSSGDNWMKLEYETHLGVCDEFARDSLEDKAFIWSYDQYLKENAKILFRMFGHNNVVKIHDNTETLEDRNCDCTFVDDDVLCIHLGGFYSIGEFYSNGICFDVPRNGWYLDFEIYWPLSTRSRQHVCIWHHSPGVRIRVGQEFLVIYATKLKKIQRDLSNMHKDERYPESRVILTNALEKFLPEDIIGIVRGYAQSDDDYDTHREFNQLGSFFTSHVSGPRDPMLRGIHAYLDNAIKEAELAHDRKCGTGIAKRRHCYAHMYEKYHGYEVVQKQALPEAVEIQPFDGNEQVSFLEKETEVMAWQKTDEEAQNILFDDDAVEFTEAEKWEMQAMKYKKQCRELGLQVDRLLKKQRVNE